MEAKILGSNNGINLVQKEDGKQFYYSTKTGKCAIGFKGLAKILGCDTKTVSRKGVALGIGRELQMYTTSGIQGVTLVMEDELPKLLSAIIKSRLKKQTRDNATTLQETFAQAGFRLMVLLEVAPEVVAKEAINNIESVEKAREVKVSAEQQEKYLESFWGLQDAIQKTEASHVIINGFNNRLVGIEKGKRKQCDAIQKRMLQVIQTTEELKLELNQDSFKSGHQATCVAKRAGLDIAEAMSKIITK